jgi:hypothetical protein
VTIPPTSTNKLSTQGRWLLMASLKRPPNGAKQCHQTHKNKQHLMWRIDQTENTGMMAGGINLPDFSGSPVEHFGDDCPGSALKKTADAHQQPNPENQLILYPQHEWKPSVAARKPRPKRTKEDQIKR